MACAALYLEFSAICSVGVEVQSDHDICEWKDTIEDQVQED